MVPRDRDPGGSALDWTTEMSAVKTFAADWLAAWNAHDLERILAHYAEDIVFLSPVAARRVGNGRVVGIAALRAYWAEGLALQPDLKFELVDVLGGHQCLTILYRNHRGQTAAETFEFRADGKAVRSFACYSAPPAPGAASGAEAGVAAANPGTNDMHLYIANKLYSSWSLRPWLLMTALDIPFGETVIPMYFPDSKARMLDVSPTGKMPCLVVPEAGGAGSGAVKVWESLAIIEYLAEKFPGKGVWPKDPAARAHARAIASEMHAGFLGLRQACPMNLAKRFHPRDDLGSDVADNLRRLEGMWSDCRRRFKGTGDFLFGDFCAADAMYAPVVTRLDTYQIPVATETRQYMNAVLAHPAFRKWRDAALAEPWSIDHYEAGWTAAEVFHRPTEPAMHRATA